MVSKQRTSLSCDRYIPSDCDRPNSIECDRCVLLNLLHPHLIQTEENNRRFSKTQQLLTQSEQNLNREGVVSLAIDGQVQFITLQAQQLLDQYFLPSVSQSLPHRLQQWFKQQTSQFSSDGDIPLSSLPLCIEQAEQQLVIHLIVDPIRKHYLLLLEEQKLLSFSIASLEVLGLTKREAEVLFWIAKDKSNAGIAKVLGCCEGTVRKHLEHLYKKLEVQTRIGAVMVALEKLGLLKA